MLCDTNVLDFPAMYETFLQHRQEAAREGRLLPDNHPYAQLVRRVGNKIASKASDGHGGGFFKHMQV